MKIALVEKCEINIRRNTIQGSRKQDFKSEAEYRDNFAKEKGFDSYTEYQNYLAKEKGFDSNAEYQKHRLKERGFENRTEYNNHRAKERGYIDNAERMREYMHDTGRRTPMSENKDCSVYLGIHVAERILAHVFKKENVERMPYGHKGYDFICGKGKKVDVKSSSFHSYMNGWLFQINNNEIAEYFLLLALSERYYGVVADDEKLKPMCIWLVPKDAIFIRRGGTKEFWDRVGIWIKNTPEGLREFEKYELKEGLEHLIECCEK